MRKEPDRSTKVFKTSSLILFSDQNTAGTNQADKTDRVQVISKVQEFRLVRIWRQNR